MKVRVYVTLSVKPADKHVEAMRFSASRRTDDKDSVSVSADPEDGKTLVAELTVPKARQMDVVDRLVQSFEDFVPDSIDFGAEFPPSEAEARKAARALERAKAKRAAAREARKDPAYRCFLCGKRTKLVKTECCGKWICDDEHKYALFSYARNSCHRNHRRLTLCAYHRDNGHEGDWKSCPQCREAFKDQLEMYVWYGTNEYNWEKLPEPFRFRGRITFFSFRARVPPRLSRFTTPRRYEAVGPYANFSGRSTVSFTSVPPFRMKMSLPPNLNAHGRQL